MFRNKMLSMLIACLCFLALSCADSPKDAGTKQPVLAVREKSPLPICIYRYNNFSISKTKYLKKKLQSVYPSVKMIPDPIRLPTKYYYAPRDRYSGRGLLRNLDQYKQEMVVLGLTNEVIYEPNEKSPTFGIFGISPVGGHVAVISSTLPSRKKHSDDHMVKLMMHELGHSFGLNHCKDEHCFMVDAEHGNHLSVLNAKPFLMGRAGN